MKKLPYLIICAAAICQSIPAQGAAGQDKRARFVPGRLWRDNNAVHINAHGGGILFHQGTYYWFGEHKIRGKAGNKAHVGVRCYSSTDLYNWNDRGITLKVSDDPNSDIVKGCILERPKVIYNTATKKFVMWFHPQWPNGPRHDPVC
jgi:hypothetical protein